MGDSNLGHSVRQLREEQGLSLRALAERIGFSASFLSQVENGQASPSISSMERIASALGVTLGEFFQLAAADARPVTRADARPVLESEWSKGRIEALGAGISGGRMAPVLVTLEPGGSSGKRAHESAREEFALVLEGRVELTLDEREQTLAVGDAVTIRPGAMRRWHNASEVPARILIVAARQG
jgi:transcriptional regulator with XRE-family HTH domain